MRGTLSLSDELTGEFRNEFDAMSISDLGLLRLLAGKLSPEAFGLLQHYLPAADFGPCLIATQKWSLWEGAIGRSRPKKGKNLATKQTEGFIVAAVGG
jgi:hypothetical protein